MTKGSARSSLKRAAISSSFWAMAGYAGGQAFRFGSNVLFTYLLYEEALALMMMVNVVVQGLQMFSDIGIGPSVVQDKRGDDPRFLGTAYTLQVIRGAVLGAVCLALTYPIAAAYAANDPAWWELERLLPFAALAVFLSGFHSIRLHMASRQLSIGRVVRIDLASQAVGVAATVAWALVDRDVFALMVGNLAGTVCKLVLSHVALRGPRDTFAWDPAAARAIFRFGGWIFISTITAFLAAQVDRLVFAASFEAGESGVFHVAASTAVMLPQVIGSLQLAVVFPLYSRIWNQGEAITPALEKVKGAVFTLSGVLVVCMIAGGQPFVEFVYDDRWVDAGWMISLLAIGAWFSMIESMYGAAMLARGKAQWIALANAAKPVVFLSIYLAIGEGLTMRDVVLASVFADMVKGLLAMWGASMLNVLTLRLDLRRTAGTFVVAAALWGVAYAGRTTLGVAPWLQLLFIGLMSLALHARLLRQCVAVLKGDRRSAEPAADGAT